MTTFRTTPQPPAAACDWAALRFSPRDPFNNVRCVHVSACPAFCPSVDPVVAYGPLLHDRSDETTAVRREQTVVLTDPAAVAAFEALDAHVRRVAVELEWCADEAEAVARFRPSLYVVAEGWSVLRFKVVLGRTRVDLDDVEDVWAAHLRPTLRAHVVWFCGGHFGLAFRAEAVDVVRPGTPTHEVGGFLRRFLRNEVEHAEAARQRACVARRWARVRRAVRARPYVLHWMEDTAKARYAPGAPGFAADQAAWAALW